jgi:SAM-dependent methyltransferase
VPPSFHDHFSAIAAGYAAYRPTYPDALFDYLAGVAPRRGLAWDCACGSGQATRSLAERFRRVIATDASAAQIAQTAPDPRVEYREAPADASGIAAASVDLITVAQAMHWLDLDRFYAEVRRVLAPDGLLAVWTYARARLDDASLDAALQEFYEGTVGPFWPPGRELAETGYRTLSFPFEELRPPLFEMACDWTLDQLLGYVGTWSATARYVAERGRDPRDDLRAALAPRWGAPRGARRVRWPLGVRIGRLGAADRGGGA